jgi:hypothetical protein
MVLFCVCICFSDLWCLILDKFSFGIAHLRNQVTKFVGSWKKKASREDLRWQRDWKNKGRCSSYIFEGNCFTVLLYLQHETDKIRISEYMQVLYGRNPQLIWLCKFWMGHLCVPGAQFLCRSPKPSLSRKVTNANCYVSNFQIAIPRRIFVTVVCILISTWIISLCSEGFSIILFASIY